MRRLLYVLLVAFFLIRHDLWLWDDPRSFLGLPAGLAWHVGYCLAAAALMALFVRKAWPVEGDGE